MFSSSLSYPNNIASSYNHSNLMGESDNIWQASRQTDRNTIGQAYGQTGQKGQKGATTLSIMTLSINWILETLSINDIQYNNTQHSNTSAIMLNVNMLSVTIYLLLCWMSLCWVSLCWMSLWWVSLCWVSWRRKKASKQAYRQKSTYNIYILFLIYCLKPHLDGLFHFKMQFSI